MAYFNPAIARGARSLFRGVTGAVKKYLTIEPRKVLTLLYVPPVASATPLSLDFKDHPSRKINNAKQAETCFLLLLGDFMGLDFEGYSPSNSLSLSFLISSLKKLKREKIVDSKDLERVIAKFQIAYQFACNTEQLAQASSTEDYIKGRRELTHLMIKALKKNGTLILEGGYASEPFGHSISIELTLKDGWVSGQLVNRGEGIDAYHSSEVDESSKYKSLELEPIPLELLEASPFLSLLIDMQMIHLQKDATEHSVDKQTLYTIEEVYEVVLTFWPGKIRDASTKPHLEQHSGSCSISPYLAILSESLSFLDRKNAKLYLMHRAFELLLEHADFETLDLMRIRDALAMMNRFTLSSERHERLDPRLKKRTLSLTEQVSAKIKESEEKILQARLNTTHDYAANVDQSTSEITLPIGRPKRPGKIDKETPKESLPPFSPNAITEFLQGAERLVKQAIKEKQMDRAKGLAHQALLEIPNPSDSFWQTKHPEEVMHLISLLAEALVKEQLRFDKPTNSTTANQATLYLKALTISLGQAGLSGVPEEIVQLYGIQTRWILEQTAQAYHLTHPVYALAFLDCHQFFQSFKREGKPIEFVSTDPYYFKEKSFSGLSELLKDKELHFLHDFAKSHDELNKELATSKREFPAMDLYKDDSFKTGVQNNLTMESTNRELHPTWEPVRQWLVLRKLHYFIIASAYLTGRVEDLSYNREAGASISFYAESSSSNIAITLNCFKPLDPKNLSYGLFQDTFFGFSREAKKLLSMLFSRSKSFMQHPRVHQNEQHLFQQTILFDSNLALSPLEIQHLLSIQTYDLLMIPQLLSFFTRYFHRLNDPRFQALFAHYLFSLNETKSALVLQEVMYSSSFVKHSLYKFLKKGLQQTKTLGWNKSHFFFLRTLAQTTRYLAEAKEPNNRLLKKMRGRLEKCMRSLLENNELPKEKRGDALCTLISCVPYLNGEQSNPLLQLCQQAKLKIQIEGHTAQVTKQLQLEEDYLKGDQILQTTEESKGVLPKWIISHRHYFLGRNFAVQQIEEGLYEFYNEKGGHYQLAVDGTEIFIYQQLQGRWYEHRKESPFAELALPTKDHPCVDGYLVSHTRNWFSIEEPKEALVFSIESDELLCRVTEEGVFHPHEPLMLATDSDLPIIAQLSRVSSLKEILAWKNSRNEVVRIEIPEYDLIFLFSEKRWKSSNHQGYFLDFHPVCPSLEPYTHYICLRNLKGRRIVLIPTWGISESPQNGFRPIKLKYNKITEMPALLTYEMNQKGQIKFPENGEHALYLIYVALRKFDYVFAKKLILRLKREQAHWQTEWCLWIKQLDSHVGDFEQKFDKHPEAIALRLQLRLLMRELTGVKLDVQQIQGLKEDYLAYLGLRKQTFGVRLNRKEELTCIKILQQREGELTEKEAFQIAVRRHALNDSLLPEECLLTEEIPKEPARTSLCEDLSWLTPEITEKMQLGAESPLPIALHLRPGSVLIHNFLYYYNIARECSKEDPRFQELLTLLRMTRHIKEPRLASLHAFLWEIPSLFRDEAPPLEDLLQSKELHKTLNEIFCFYVKGKESSYPEAWSFQAAKNSISHSGVPKSVSFEPTQPKRSTPLLLESAKVKDLSLCDLLASKNCLVKQTWKTKKREIKQELKYLQEMEAYFAECHDENPCVEREFARLIRGIHKKRRGLSEALASKEQGYLLDLEQIKTTKAVLQSLHHSYTKQIEEREKQILKIAYHYPESLHLEKEGRMCTPLTMEELIVNFGTGGDETISASNPSLTAENLKELKQLLADYLILRTDHNQILSLSHHLEEVVKQINLKGSTSPEVKSAADACVRIATAQRVYDPIEEKHLLTFEFFGKLRLRKEQYRALIEMTSTEENIELEARTGFGKSKVLIPLWLFLKSRKDKVAMMTLPSSLFIAQNRHLKKILGKAFDALIVPIQFSREKSHDLKYLKRLCQQLEYARQSHKIILTTIQSIHGMANLKLKEALASGKGAHETKVQTKLRELRGVISKQIACFFDESKVCFNIHQRYDYAIGALSSVDPKHAANASLLYRELILKGDISTRFNFEFLPHSDAVEKIIPLQANYDKEFLPEFAQHIALYFKVPDQYRKAILEDLQGYYSEECEGFYKTLSEKKQQEYAQLKKHLTSHLRRTLFRKCEDGYAFYPGTRLAIPFLDGTAKKTSEFSEVEDYINFTIQANLKKPFTEHDIATYIDALKMRALEGELKKHELELLKRVSNLSLMTMDTSDYQVIAQKINSDLRLKLDFIECAILPQIKMYKKKVTSTAFNLIRAIRHIQAASGIVDPDMLPPKLSTKEDEEAIIDNFLALWKNSQKRIFNLKRAPPEEKLKTLLTERVEASVFIDVAGSFRELGPVKTAQIILETRPQAKGVLFYDEEGQEFVYERATQAAVSREDSPLESEELIFFIRKSKAVGTDTEMPLTAQAVVTVDRDTCQDLFFQGTGRMRKLREGQIVGYAVEEEDLEIIFQQKERLFKHLAAYTICSQGKQKGDDAFYILRLFLEDLIDAAFWEAASHCQTTQEVQILFKVLQHFIVQETQTEVSLFTRKQRGMLAAKDAVAQLKTEMLSPVGKFCKECPLWAHLFDIDKMSREFDDYVDYDKLPKEIILSNSEESVSSVEASIDHDNTNDQTTDLDLDHENLTDQATEVAHISFNPDPPLAWDGNYVSLFSGKPQAQLLGIPIFYSPNFARVSKDEEENSRVQKPAHQYLVFIDTEGKLCLALLDLYDARQVMNRMLNDRLLKGVPASTKLRYYLFSGPTAIAADCTALGHRLNPSDSLVLDSIQAIQILRKLFTPTPTLTEEEIHYLSQFSSSEVQTFIHYVEQLQALWPHLASLTIQCKQAFSLSI